MCRSVLRILAQFVFVLVGVSIVVFGLARLTGDPTLLLLPQEATAQQRLDFRTAHGLEDPIYIQYARFMRDLCRGDLGKSLLFSEPTLDIVLQRLPATLELSFAAAIIVVVIGIPAGVIAAVRYGSILDRSVILFATFGQSLATFWLGILLILVFAVHWQLVPPSGRGSISQLILPAITLSMYATAVIARLTRSSMLEVIGEDFVRTAQSKGVGPMRLVCRHVFVNTLIPIVTVFGVLVGNLFAGAVVTEAVFAWPGLGSLTVQAIYGRDYPLVQAVILFFAFVYTIINTSIELLYSYLDPRTRLT